MPTLAARMVDWNDYLRVSPSGSAVAAPERPSGILNNGDSQLLAGQRDAAARQDAAVALWRI